MLIIIKGLQLKVSNQRLALLPKQKLGKLLWLTMSIEGASGVGKSLHLSIDVRRGKEKF